MLAAPVVVVMKVVFILNGNYSEILREDGVRGCHSAPRLICASSQHREHRVDTDFIIVKIQRNLHHPRRDKFASEKNWRPASPLELIALLLCEAGRHCEGCVLCIHGNNKHFN